MGLVFGDLGECGKLVHLLEAPQPVAQASRLWSDHNHWAARWRCTVMCIVHFLLYYNSNMLLLILFKDHFKQNPLPVSPKGGGNSSDKVGDSGSILSDAHPRLARSPRKAIRHVDGILLMLHRYEPGRDKYELYCGGARQRRE